MKEIIYNAETCVSTERELDANEYDPFENVCISYEQRVIDMIRERYTLDEELSIQRQRYTKPYEFDAYFNYCENCKLKAKGIVQL